MVIHKCKKNYILYYSNIMFLKTIILVFISFSCIATTFGQVKDNYLTEKEKEKGWKLLFNGSDLDGWTSVGKDQPPSTGWKVENGILIKTENERGGDIITSNEYSDFELSLEFKITEGANSGIKYFFTEYEKGGWLGFEFQLLDDENHPDAKMGRNGNRLQGTLYDMFPLDKDHKNVPGQWVQAKIIAKGPNVEHYLNGEKVLSFDRNSDNFKEAWKQSKYKDSKPQFGKVEKGHILLQDHGDEVFFKNIKIKTL